MPVRGKCKVSFLLYNCNREYNNCIHSNKIVLIPLLYSCYLILFWACFDLPLLLVCSHLIALYKFTFTLAFTVHYDKNGCVLQRLRRILFKIFFKYFPPSTLTCCTIYSIKLIKVYGMCLIFKIESFAV